MNKNVLLKFAVWARRALLEPIRRRALEYAAPSGSGKGHGFDAAGRAPADEEPRRRELAEVIARRGVERAAEEAACAWFLRLAALRYMELSGALPARVFSDKSGRFSPGSLRSVTRLNLPGLGRVLSAAPQTDGGRAPLRHLLALCRALSGPLPELFGSPGDWVELLLPGEVLEPGGVADRMVSDIPEADWKDVRVLGWLYQFYNTEPKKAVLEGLRRNEKISRENIPAATQLFTPDWIARYLVENTLGRLWLESRPEGRLKAKWAYYIDLRGQAPDTGENGRATCPPLASPEAIRLIDPCAGSGNILVCAFDVLLDIYESAGYSSREAARLILEKNLFGLDIDPRAARLAAFVLKMKALRHDPSLLARPLRLPICHPAGWGPGEAFGSLARPEQFPEEPPEGDLAPEENAFAGGGRLFRRLLSRKYDVVVTNPPYMGGKVQSPELAAFLKARYPDAKADTFSAFMVRCLELARPGGFAGLFTPYVWMFIRSFEGLRRRLYAGADIVSLIQLEYSAFEEATVPVCAFVLRNGKTGAPGEYLRLTDFRGGMEVQRAKALDAIADPLCGYRYTAGVEGLAKLPGAPLAYWLGEGFLRACARGAPLGRMGRMSEGVKTGDNERFLRLWFEVEAPKLGGKWVFYHKGGEFRRWYGNLDYVIDWEDGGRAIRGAPNSALQGSDMYFKPVVCWSKITSRGTAFRYVPPGCLFDSGSPAFYSEERLLYVLGLLNSKVAREWLTAANPTLNTQVGDVKSIPCLVGREEEVCRLVARCLDLSRADWDEFETSRDFARHPMVRGERTAEAAYSRWKRETEERFEALRAREEALNRVFLELYGLEGEMSPAVEDRDVTVRRIFDSREDIPPSMETSRCALTRRDAAVTFISYGVGCLFGRYSLDAKGLAFAGGPWDPGRYRTLRPVRDNILPLSGGFENDILAQFEDFLRAAFREETLEENLAFLAGALGGNGAPREVLRRYFLREFYRDHLKTYRRRPIYWLFDSGPKGGFKALVYLHRFTPDLFDTMRREYVSRRLSSLRAGLGRAEAMLGKAAGAERARLLRERERLSGQLDELEAFDKKLSRLAERGITINPDDGVRRNYALLADVLAKI